MKGATAIPLLPCVSLGETLDFYRHLGFEVTHRQTAPNPYAALHQSGCDLHFFGLKGLEPARAYSTCLVVVDEVEELHQTFAGALRQTYNKVPITGIPRISRMRKGQTRFTLTDPNGNSIIFVRRGEPQPAYVEPDSVQGPRSRLAKALDAAARLRDFKTDDAAAAKVLDVALARNEPATPLERARALAARMELALALGDPERAQALRAELQGLSLTGAERKQLQPELRAADELQKSLGQRDDTERPGARKNKR
ncbi:VOC family protein [Pyxidicoccus xibeiensis]|uniref:VOC family protein n=1 Tax=Pyxidicoccus xibeiensis TaxID=2906759 RepID=UPI0020A7F9CF|nr:VOC family protein [Pyxidicoccus xibeiensis]MCP3144910.1 hypothetical protein [Pyxidicoccus xibeiensis]